MSFEKVMRGDNNEEKIGVMRDGRQDKYSQGSLSSYDLSAMGTPQSQQIK